MTDINFGTEALEWHQWNEGHLRYLLSREQPYAQTEMYDFYHNWCANNPNDYGPIVIEAHRQMGKTVGLVTIAKEKCYRDPNSLVLYLSDSYKHAKAIVKNKFVEFKEWCPAESLWPQRSEFTFTYPNGSQIQIYGLDTHKGDDLRGQTADLIIIDEAGFVDNLDETIESALNPILLRRPGSKMILSSTPPKSMAHPYIKYVEQARRDGRLFYTNYKLNKDFTPQMLEKALKGYEGGEDNERFRREYGCEHISDQSNRIIAAFNEKMIIDDYQLPVLNNGLPYWRPFMGADWGFEDFTAILYGIYDYLNNRLVILDEEVFHRADHDKIHSGAFPKEEILYSGAPTEIIRYSDDQKDYTVTFSKAYQWYWQAADKYKADEAMRYLNANFANGNILIHKRCQNTIKQLLHGVYDVDDQGFVKGMQRTKEMGHCDCIDALKYLNRMVPRQSPPPNEVQHSKAKQFIDTPKPINHNLGKMLGN